MFNLTATVHVQYIYYWKFNIHPYIRWRTNNVTCNEQTKLTIKPLFLHYVKRGTLYSLLYAFTIAATMVTGDNQRDNQKMGEENFTNQEMQRTWSSEFSVHCTCTCSYIYALTYNVPSVIKLIAFTVYMHSRYNYKIFFK